MTNHVQPTALCERQWITDTSDFLLLMTTQTPLRLLIVGIISGNLKAGVHAIADLRKHDRIVVLTHSHVKQSTAFEILLVHDLGYV